ncbi:MAG: beta-sandwich domain-containing protein, partial [Bacteroidota bacterium]
MAQEDSAAVKDCVVYLNNDKRSTTTDGRGRFLFNDLPNGTYTLHFTSLEHNYATQKVVIANSNRYVEATLASRTETLQEVMITASEAGFGFTRMRA